MTDFYGTVGDDQQSGTFVEDTFYFSQGGNDSLNGRDGNDQFRMGASLNADDHINGGDGYDVVIIDGDYPSLILGTSTLANVEELTFGYRHNYSVVTNDANVAAGSTLKIGASSIDRDHTLIFDGSAELDGRFDIFGSAGKDHLIGGAMNDAIDGLYGGDVLEGGAGDDALAGWVNGDVDYLYGDAGDDSIACNINDVAYGGGGNDRIDAEGYVKYPVFKAYGGSGNDRVHVSNDTTIAALEGGAGNDNFICEGRVTLTMGEFTAATSGFERISVTGALIGTDATDTFDLSGMIGAAKMHGLGGEDRLTGATADDSLFGDAGNDLLTGSTGNDRLNGGGGADTLGGGEGDDLLLGSANDDTLIGRKGADFLKGGSGADTFVYFSMQDTLVTSLRHEVIKGFVVTDDKFDMPDAVAAIDEPIDSGTLSRNSFDVDLGTAVDAAHLGGGNAVLYSPDAGTLAGRTFLILDANEVAGYQPGEDFVVELAAAGDLSALSVANFI